MTDIIFKSFVTFLKKVLIKHYITYHASFCYMCDYATQISLMPLLQDKSNHEVLAARFLGEKTIIKKKWRYRGVSVTLKH